MRLLKLFQVATHLLRGALILRFNYDQHSAQHRAAVRARWAHEVLGHFGMQLNVHGLPEQAVLLVSNHVSWLDVLVLEAAAPSAFVAKQEVAHWPLVGWMCRRTGTRFIDRTRRAALKPACEELSCALRAGQRVALFPEATTSNGQSVLPFHSGLFQAALDAEAHVQPVALVYRNEDGSVSDLPAYIGDMSLFGSMWRLAGGSGLSIELRFGEPIQASVRSRQQLARNAHAAVVALRGNTPLAVSAYGSRHAFDSRPEYCAPMIAPSVVE